MKIGIFDSGYGGLTILEKIRARLPQYDYIYFGDNARTPYGSRSFEVVYQYTLECVKRLFDEELSAKQIGLDIISKLPKENYLVSCKLWETDTSYAEFNALNQGRY